MKYLHGSTKIFGKDFILLPQPDGYANTCETPEFEAYVESRRPSDKLSRLKSVFLSEDADLIDGAGGYTDAIYEVKPLSPPEGSDLAWYTEAFGEFDSKQYGGTYDSEKLDSCIDAYWSGIPYSDPENSNFEYRVSSAQVVRMVELNVELSELERPNSKAQNLSPTPN